MKQVISVLFIIALVLGGSSCKTKPDCEFDHTGSLEITNSDSRSSEVRLDGSKLFVLDAGETREKEEVASGTHTIRCFTVGSEPAELEEEIVINDCETTSFEINY
ncbi:MAG: hypothetical protein ACQES0_08695 [Bacteroidota bacterium]